MQGNNGWTDVRMFYSKTGMAKYISHLDMVRCFSRAMKRAEVPIWFTEGFNPHAFLTFAMPLSLGTESYCETVDFRLTEDVDLKELTERINKTLPPDIRVTEIAEPKFTAHDIKYAEYKITFNSPSNDFLTVANERLSSDEIIVEKKGKQGRRKVTKEVNIKEHIKSFELTEDGGNVVLHIFLSAGTSFNINPSLVIGAIIKDTDVDEASCDIVKVQSYTENMEIFK